MIVLPSRGLCVFPQSAYVRHLVISAAARRNAGKFRRAESHRVGRSDVATVWQNEMFRIRYVDVDIV